LESVMEKSTYRIMTEFTDAVVARHDGNYAYAAGYLEQTLGDILDAKDGTAAMARIESALRSIVKITEEMNANV